MIAARPRPATQPSAKSRDKRQKPTLQSFIDARDFTGASTLLEFNRSTGEADDTTLPWLAYAFFHGGEFAKALEVIKEMQKFDENDPHLSTFRGCCHFFLGQYEEAERCASKVDPPSSRLQVRLLFQVAHRMGDENKLLKYHQKLMDATDDQLSLASIHYLRGHYQEAIDVYKRILLENRDFIALNVFIALCFYKLDYYDVSLEMLQPYMQKHPDSVVGLNLKACNAFRMLNGKAAAQELKPLLDSLNAMQYGADLIKHNVVVFRGGDGALQTLPGLLHAIPEARLNLVVYYLHQGELTEAHKLVKDVEPSTPQEYILKAVVLSALGQQQQDREMIKLAQQYFQVVGSSASECDTIPGRQCMAACFFLMKSFDDVCVYLKSIKQYFYTEDVFNWNFGIAKASIGEYAEAEETLLLVQSEQLRAEYIYVSWLARCYIRNMKPRLAWEMYSKMEAGADSFKLLQLIGHDAYRMGAFYYSAKAFDMLERMDPTPEFWEGKRGACVGVFQQVVAGKESRDTLREVIDMLRNTTNPQVEYIIRSIRKWEKENA